MLLMPYLVCGLFYGIYTFKKIFDNYQQFTTLFENEFDSLENLNSFLGLTFLSCLLAWPIMMLNELKSKQDLE